MKPLFDPELEKFLEALPKEGVDLLEVGAYPCNSSPEEYEFTYVKIKAVSQEAHDHIYEAATHLLEQQEHIYNLTGNANAWLTEIINSRKKSKEE